MLETGEVQRCDTYVCQRMAAANWLHASTEAPDGVLAALTLSPVYSMALENVKGARCDFQLMGGLNSRSETLASRQTFQETRTWCSNHFWTKTMPPLHLHSNGSPFFGSLACHHSNTIQPSGICRSVCSPRYIGTCEDYY